MKIRHGFVSNSSSTSFAVIMKKNVYNETIKKLHPYIRHLLKASNFRAGRFAGQKVMIMSTVFNSEDFEVSTYEKDEGIDVNGNVVKLEKDEDGDINVYGLQTDCDALITFIKEAKKIDTESVEYITSSY